MAIRFYLSFTLWFTASVIFTHMSRFTIVKSQFQYLKSLILKLKEASIN